jgi:hypothetical protein
MISPVQWRAFRDLVVQALTVNVPAAVQTIQSARIVKAGRDHPAPALPWCTLTVIGAEELGLDGERLYTLIDEVLVETVRTEWSVTMSLQIATRTPDDAPSLAHDAWILARRVATRLRGSAAADELVRVGTGIRRISGLRDLSRYTGSQAESRVALDVELGIAVLDTAEPGWISSVAGVGTLIIDGGASLTVPFTGDDTEP